MHEIKSFGHFIIYFFCTHLIIPEDEQIGGLVLTNLAANEYPILSDLMEVIREEKALHTSEDEAYTYISKIELVIENLITNYGYIFNGHTSIEDILSDQIVFFDIKNLAGMKSEIFDAQLFSSLSICWDNCIKIGRPMKELFDNHKIAWEDIRRFMVLIDESHKTINAFRPLHEKPVSFSAGFTLLHSLFVTLCRRVQAVRRLIRSKCFSTCRNISLC